MKKAIFIRIFTVLMIGLLICSLLAAWIFSADAARLTKQDMLKMLHIIDGSLTMDDPNAEAERLARLNDGMRVTVIGLDGTVLGDSDADPADMASHKGRQEFEDALRTGAGVSRRQSETIGVYQLYVAARSDKGVIMRLSANVDGPAANILKLLPAVLAAAGAALVISLVIAVRFTGSLTRPFQTIEQALTAVKTAEEPARAAPSYPELDGILSRIGALTQDISDSRASLEAERDKLGFILSSMEEGVILIDREERLLLLNTSAGRLLRTQAKPGSSADSLTADPKLLQACRDAVLAGRPSLFDLAVGEITVSVRITPVEAGFLSGALIVLADVTADRDAVRLRQEFFSNASHELKTPITSIYGFADLLEQGLVPDEAARAAYISRIKQESGRMSELISDILLISRLEQNKAPPQRREISLTALAKELAADLAPQAAAQEVTLSVSDEPVLILADPRQMHELLLNLMENAVKYNKPGGTVSVTLSQREGRTGILVEDTGIGIPPGDQSRIFERFYRADRGRSQKRGGTGLGLSIVKHIVTGLGGSIELKSKENAGTRVEITLPADDNI